MSRLHIGTRFVTFNNVLVVNAEIQEISKHGPVTHVSCFSEYLTKAQ